MLASAGRVAEILVQHTMLLEERQEYAAVAMGLALAGFQAEARALAEAGRAWGSGDPEALHDVLAQIPEVITVMPDDHAIEAQPWAADADDRGPLAGFLDDASTALDEGRWGDAVAVLLEGRVGLVEPHLCAWVAEQAERSGVSGDHLAELLGSAAEGEIFRANRRSYERAASHLTEVRRLLLGLGRHDDWVSLLDTIRRDHARKSALLEVLSPLLSDAGLSS
jgi:hypothetical protein